MNPTLDTLSIFVFLFSFPKIRIFLNSSEGRPAKTGVRCQGGEIHIYFIFGVLIEAQESHLKVVFHIFKISRITAEVREVVVDWAGCELILQAIDLSKK